VAWDERRAGITAVAASLPEARMTTADLQRRIEESSQVTFPANVFARLSGIRERRVATPEEQASTLAVTAARELLRTSGVDPQDIDLLLFSSASRDVTEPATAHIVQHELGTSAHAFDIANACNSFLNGIDTARAFVLAGRARRVLVVTGETPTRVMRLKVGGLDQVRDSLAGYTFGDGGAAVLVEPVTTGGIQHVVTATASEYWEVGGIAGGGSRHPRSEEHTYFHGNGSELREVFERFGQDALDRLRKETGYDWDDYDRILVHQVTLSYLDRFAEFTGAPKEKMVVTLPELGNLASATLGVQLARINADLRTGQRVLFVGLGAGASIMMMVWEKS
jgi:3-oxoacyl-(acyl-carrier-protein) synthase III